MNDDMLTSQSLFIEPPRPDRIAAISGVVHRRPIVLVLGMHRSGTSLCSHLLSALGVDMADELPGPGKTSLEPDNPRGHWERWEIVEFHDRIFHLFNRDYFGRFHDFALPVAWWAEPRITQIRREIIAFLETRMGDGYFGFKDPRTVRLMPMWHQIFNELKLAPKIMLCLRNPAQVARSLNARNGLDPEIGEYRWLVHMIDFFRYCSNFDYCAIKYEDWFDNPAANIEKLKKFLDLPWQQSEADLALLLSDVVDPGARHDAPAHQEAGQPLVRTLYQLASRDGQDGARDQIAYIVSQFVSFQQLQRPFLRAFEEVAKIAGKLPESEQEAAALRTALGERDAIIETAERRASDAEARLTDAVAENEAQRGQIAELASEANGLRAMLAEREAGLAELSRRVDELLAAQQAARAELAAREAALDSAERARQEREAAAAQAMQSQIVALQQASAKAEGEAQERAAAMRAEMAALRDGLARAEGEAQQRTASEAALQGEIEGLRATAAQAERAAKERAATVVALQAEIGGLQEALTAARQVGKAAIAAFRSETAAAVKSDEPRGWRSAILRFFGIGAGF